MIPIFCGSKSDANINVPSIYFIIFRPVHFFNQLLEGCVGCFIHSFIQHETRWRCHLTERTLNSFPSKICVELACSPCVCMGSKNTWLRKLYTFRCVYIYNKGSKSFFYITCNEVNKKLLRKNLKAVKKKPIHIYE